MSYRLSIVYISFLYLLACHPKPMAVDLQPAVVPEIPTAYIIEEQKEIFEHDGLRVEVSCLDKADLPAAGLTADQALYRVLTEGYFPIIKVAFYNNTDAQLVFSPQMMFMREDMGVARSPMDYADIYMALGDKPADKKGLDTLSRLLLKSDLTLNAGKHGGGWLIFPRINPETKLVQLLLNHLYLDGESRPLNFAFQTIPVMAGEDAKVAE